MTYKELYEDTKKKLKKMNGLGNFVDGVLLMASHEEDLKSINTYITNNSNCKPTEVTKLALFLDVSRNEPERIVEDDEQK